MKIQLILLNLILSLQACSAHAKNDSLLFITLKEFKWTLGFEGGGSSSNLSLNIDKGKILVSIVDLYSDKIIEVIEIDSVGNKNKYISNNLKKTNRYLNGYVHCYEERVGQKSFSKCSIPLKDSSIIKSSLLEYFQPSPRGADVWSSLYLTNHKGKTVKLEFSHNPATDGYISIHDIVQFNSTSFVLTYWYYKRFGDSNVQIGFLDLKKYLED